MMKTLETYEADLRAQGYSERTIRAKLGAPRRAADWNQVEPNQLTRDDVVAWLGSRDRAAWTRLKYLDHVKAWCAWAGIPDATVGIRRPLQPSGIPRPVSEHDLVAILRACESARDRCWVVLGAYAGLRAHESAQVAVGDLEETTDGEHLLRLVGKGNQLQIVPAAPVVVTALREAREEAGVVSGRIWPKATSDMVQQTVLRAATRAGVRCTSHQLRHRYGTAVHAATGDLLLTQRLMRHASPKTTVGYALVSARRDHGVVRNLPGADSLPAPGERPALRLV